MGLMGRGGEGYDRFGASFQMHDTALKTGELFFKCYGKEGCSILEVGALDVNGSIRPFAPKGSTYTGVDTSPGPGVDIVINLDDPLPAKEFDLVLATSCFEHDPQFWATFENMCKVAKPGGFIYISAPSNGPIHRHPVDCWRFLPDSADALANWVSKTGELAVNVIENFRMFPSRDGWIDQVCVFGRRKWAAPEVKLRDALLKN